MYRTDWDLVTVPNLNLIYEGKIAPVDISYDGQWVAKFKLKNRGEKETQFVVKATVLSLLSNEVRRTVDMWLRSDRPEQGESDLCGISGLVARPLPVKPVRGATA